MKFTRNEDGQALVFCAMCMTLLMGVMALAVDVGNIHYRQIQLQTAADSAAIAAGLEMGNCSDTVCANMKTATQKALIEDGITTATITPTTNQCTITNTSSLAMIINVAPCILGSTDPNKGNAHMAEVVLTQPQPTIFGRIFGIPTMNLVARAEAGDAYVNSTGSGNCIWTNGLQFNSSNGTFNLQNCGIYDNGNLQTNSGDGVTASSTFLYYGSWSPNNCNSSCVWSLGDSETQPTHTTTQQTDPLASLSAPSKPAASSTASNTTPNSGATLQPGAYTSGINLNSGVSVNLAPGLYYMNGSINVNSGATLTCTGCTSGQGVTLYFTSGSFQPNSGSTVNLTAATTNLTNNAVKNMLVWESSTNSTQMNLDASTAITLNGTIYLPDATLTLNSGSGTTINGGATNSAIDANDIIVNSGVSLVVNGSQSLLGGGSGQTLGSFALAE